VVFLEQLCLRLLFFYNHTRYVINLYCIRFKRQTIFNFLIICLETNKQRLQHGFSACINKTTTNTTHAVNNDNNDNMMLHQEPQVLPQQTPLNVAAQPIVEQEALNGQLEDVEVKDDNEYPNSDNNNKDNNSNTVNWLDH